jgi:hypothetical protein
LIPLGLNWDFLDLFRKRAFMLLLGTKYWRFAGFSESASWLEFFSL